MNDVQIIQFVAEKIRKRRDELGLTQLQVAEKAGISVNHYAKTERAEGGKPKGVNWLRIAAALEIDYRDLFPPRAKLTA